MASMQYLDPQGRLLRQIDSLVLEASGLYHLDADLGNTSLSADTENTLSGIVLKDLHTSRFNKPLILLLLTSLGQQAKLATAVSKIGDELALLRKEITAPKAAPPTSNPRIIQKLDALIGKANTPTPTPQAPHRPTPPAKPALPRATPTHAQVVRSAPNPPNTPSKKTAKTAQASAPGSSPKEKALPAAHRRFFATRITPSPITDAEKLSATLPRLFGLALARNNQTAPVTSLSVTINPRGTVSVTAPPTVPSTVYAPFFEALTTILNVEVATPENPFTTFRPAPTNVDLAIHGVPLYELPNQECLEEILPSALRLAVGITPAAVRFPNTDESSRCAKATTSVVVSVTADEAATIGTTIRLFSRPRRCNVMGRASTSTQCRNCCKLGHATQGCRSPTACPLCTLPHKLQDHRCSVPSCKGASAPLENCCEISPAKCVNCSGAHRSFTPSCPSRKPTTTANPPSTHTAMDISQEDVAPAPLRNFLGMPITAPLNPPLSSQPSLR
ncbi:uncharacterized protein LAJ45_03529 [Morchella importuna]|uniref:uncharacterized protein n=1 Tax=Morchella importuna TaxID=1174673 RepID=UPI001E8E9BBA|nr:uncharacterized protein LAJ45_03529 [Morchella importuna]KAH8152688.1 hypothetical protein LAJ45_03529 [Morchella importuna]